MTSAPHRTSATIRLNRTLWAKTALASCIVLSLGACSTGADPDPSPGTDAERAAASDQVIERLVSNPEGPGCSAAVARNGEVIWAGAAGSAQVSSSTPITLETAFDIGSVSKHVTGMATLLLVEDGLVDLDAAVATYLPDIGPWAETTTVSQLLTHTSGLPDYIDIAVEAGASFSDHVTMDMALDLLSDIPGTATPAPWVYSNSNYIVLARLVEVVSGQPFSDFAEERLFTPAGSNLRVDPLAKFPEIAARYSDIAGADGEIEVNIDVVGDGAIVATPSELAAWFDVFRTGLPDHPTIQDEMVADAVEMPGAYGGAYGAGIMVFPNGRITHSGQWAGHLTNVSMSPDHSTTLAISCNSEDLAAEVLLGLSIELEMLWWPTE